MGARFDEAVLRQQIIARDLAVSAARASGVCSRPLVAFVTDIETGDRKRVPIPCGATQEHRCPACADRARRLRMHQCREGWHLTEEPLTDADRQDDAARSGWFDLPGCWEPLTTEDDDLENRDGGAGSPFADVEEDDDGAGGCRRVRSTRRRPDVPELPKVPMGGHTLGRIFQGKQGKVHRPSMFITLTMGSYGPVTAEGVPRNPESYDYRRAALDAMHLPKLVDRFWQNLRRCCGFEAQYFATIEPQKRLAPHLHAAIRGAIPRAVFRQVVAATYHQLWWPPHDQPVYLEQLPAWDDHHGGYTCPESGRPLPAWDESLDQLGADDAEPAHLLVFGGQAHLKGLEPGRPETDRTIGYLTKYLTKSVVAAYDDELYGDDPVSPARQAHIDRIHEETRWLPCSPTCSNWLRYGVQPKDARPGLVPGHCRGRAHKRENLGLGGRRVLASRRWTGKTLTTHRADRTDIVRAALREAGIDPDDHTELSATAYAGRWQWHVVPRSQLDPHTYAAAIGDLIETRCRWRNQYTTARAGPPARSPDLSAINEEREKEVLAWSL